MEAVAAGDEVARAIPAARRRVAEAIAGRVAIDALQRTSPTSKASPPPAARRAAIRSLTISCCPYTVMRLPVSAEKVDAMAAPVEAQDDAVVDETLARPSARRRPARRAARRYPCSRTPGAHALLAVGAAARLEDDRLDPRPLQQLRQQQPGRPGADDPDLGRFRAPLSHRRTRSATRRMSP